MLDARTTYVPSTDGVEVAVHDFGGEGPPLLLCHATGFCAHTLAPLIEDLRAHFQCVALDIRAHGLTRLPDGASLRWTAMAADVAAVARTLAPEGGLRAFGHSMGATSIILAEVDQPGLFGPAWLFEPILLDEEPELTGDDAPAIAVAAARRRATFDSRDEAIQRYGSRPPLSLLDERALAAYVDHGFATNADGSITLRCRPEHESRIFANHGSGSAQVIGQVRNPMVVARGAVQDPPETSPGAWVEAAAERHPHLTVAAFDQLSHFGPLQDPGLVAGEVARFLLGETTTR